jgi:hypothetical protein
MQCEFFGDFAIFIKKTTSEKIKENFLNIFISHYGRIIFHDWILKPLFRRCFLSHATPTSATASGLAVRWFRSPPLTPCQYPLYLLHTLYI